MLKIDKKDRMLLYELDKNSRQSYSELAKKVKLSQEAVRYRINNLLKRKIINKFFTAVNLPKLNLTIYKVLLKLHNINEQKKTEIVDYLIANQLVLWVGDVEGSFDIAFTFGVDNLMKASSFFSGLYDKYGKQINQRQISVNLVGQWLTRDYLTGKQRTQPSPPSYSESKEVEMIDSVDKNILYALCENARTSAVDIASDLKLSSDTIIKRIRKLEKQNILTRYRLEINNSEMSQIHYKVFIYLNDLSKEKVNSFLEHCRMQERIFYIITSFGEWDIELDIEVSNVNEFKGIMMDLTNKFSDIIRDYSYLTVYKVLKFNMLPKGILED